MSSRPESFRGKDGAEGSVPSQRPRAGNTRDTPRATRAARHVPPLIALLAVLLLAACSDEVPVRKEQITDQPTTDSTPMPVSVDLPSLVLGPEAPFPDGVALLLETGCFQCDGPATGLIRVYRDETGIVRSESLVSTAFAGDIPIPHETIDTIKGPQQYDPYVTGIAVSGDGSEMIVSVCVYAGCGIGMDAWSPKGRANLYRSVDGGRTWAEYGSMDGGAVIGILGSGRALAYRYADGMEAFSAPDQEVIERPDIEAGGVGYPPFVLSGGAIAWQNRLGALHSPDGTKILVVPQLLDVACPCRIGWAAQQPFGDKLIALAWSANVPGPGFVSLFTSAGAHLKTVSTTNSLLQAVWLSDHELIANVGVEGHELSTPVAEPFLGLLPAIVDLNTGEIHPITEYFLEDDAERGRNYIRGIQRLE